MAPKITFSYFPMRGGRGEAIRFALHVAGVEWENADVTWDQYQTKKSGSKDLAWHNGMPVLTIDGKAYTQSIAQARSNSPNTNFSLWTERLLLSES
eukprot:2697456-Pyramimonas_sp.AAC.1